MSKVESHEASALELNDDVGFPAGEATDYADGDVLKDSQGDQNSGWFEVKKKSRFSGKSNVHKTTTSKKLAGPCKKEILSLEQNGRENRAVLSAALQQMETLSCAHEHVSVETQDYGIKQSSEQIVKEDKAKSSFEEQKGSSACKIGGLTIASNDMNISKGDISCGPLTAEEMVATFMDPPKFKWGNLDDEDLTQSNLLESQERRIKSLQASSDESPFNRIEDSIICLEGGKQSSTKQFNGIKNDDLGKALDDFAHVVDAGCNTSDNANASPASESSSHSNAIIGEGFKPASEIPEAELSVPTSTLGGHDIFPSNDRAQNPAMPSGSDKRAADIIHLRQ